MENDLPPKESYIMNKDGVDIIPSSIVLQSIGTLALAKESLIISDPKGGATFATEKVAHKKRVYEVNL